MPWWSFGKTVLAAAALVLVDQGKLCLSRAVPPGTATLRQLLQHRSGLPDYGELADYHTDVARRCPAWPASEMLQRVDGLGLMIGREGSGAEFTGHTGGGPLSSCAVYRNRGGRTVAVFATDDHPARVELEAIALALNGA